MQGAILTIAGLCLSTFLVACGGSQPEAKEPEPSSEAESSSKESADTPAKGDGDGDGADAEGSGKADKGKGEEKAKEEEKKAPVRSAKDILTRPDVLFMVSFSASEPYQAAEKKCAEKAKDDPKKKADCMGKASKDFDSDGVAFLEQEEKWWWLTVRRQGGKLVTLHKIAFEWGEDGESKVTIKPRGPDKGTKPMGGIPKEVTIDINSDSQIAIQDSKQGKLVYEAKMGLMGPR